MVFDDVARITAAFAVCALLAGCATSGESGLSATNLVYDHRATTPAYPTEDPRLFPDDDINSAPSMIEGGMQCVPYVRAHSAIDIHGDAYTWWEKAAGLYQRSAAPAQGAVMVMVGYAGKHRAHVAVVRRVVTPREIRIDHANWLNDGAIYVNDPVVDVSPDNDWSQVKVWNIRSGTWGTKTYALKGFIGPGSDDGNAIVSSSGVPTDDPIARQIAASGGAQDYPASPTVNALRARSIR